jgi:hypothetical protein
MVTCTSFSASANVAGLTAGPDPAPVPNVGGAPGVAGVPGAAGDDCEIAGSGSLRHALAATRTPSGAVIKNCRRVFMGQEAYSPATAWAMGGLERELDTLRQAIDKCDIDGRRA